MDGRVTECWKAWALPTHHCSCPHRRANCRHCASSVGSRLGAQTKDHWEPLLRAVGWLCCAHPQEEEHQSPTDKLMQLS